MTQETPCQKPSVEERNEELVSLAAKTSLYQSAAFSAQNEVDAIRNQHTVRMVATGSAYAKWLQNPAMGDEFKALIDTSKVTDKAYYVDVPDDKNEPVRLSTQIFREFIASLKMHMKKDENR